MTDVRLTIDGTPVTVAAGATLLDAARQAGLDGRIPHLCHFPGSLAQGSCRLCQVTVAGHRQPVAACTTSVETGMAVTTGGPAIQGLRKAILALMAEHAPGAACPSPGRGGAHGREFADLLDAHGIDRPIVAPTDAPAGHPFLRFNASACIVCRRCLQACEDLQGQFVFAIGERGSHTRLLFGNNETFTDTPCVSCGACVEACPTGALYDVDRADNRGDGEKTTRTVCGYCGVGCAVDVTVAQGSIQRISGTPAAVVNHGHLCAKGRYAHGWTRSRERLKSPLLRVGNELREVSWEHALDWVAGQLKATAEAHGPASLGLLTSSRSTNEAAYLLQKVFRSLLRTNNVDCCARVCHSSTALALSQATGTGAASASYSDIERARVIVVAGANPTEAHPVVGARLKQAARRGARLIVIDPRRIELVDYAALHLPVVPGTNVALFNALAKCLLEQSLADQDYVTERTEGLGALRGYLEGLSLPELATVCGVPTEAVREAARLIGAGPVLFVTGLGLSELTQGTAAVLGLTNIALLTGSIGRPGAGMLPLRGQNNVQGNADMGCAPAYLPGYDSLADPVARERVGKIWGVAPPGEPGLTIPEMLQAARTRKLRALWVQGEDILQSDPNETAVRLALESLDLLVVQELFMSETARYATLVLPAAGVFEQDGTFTNGERRIQRVRAVLAPPGEARPDWIVARDLAGRLGADWGYEHPGQIMEEIAAVAPGLFGGVTYERLDGEGLQWPVPDPGHPGTPIVHAEGFVRGRARFSVVPYQPSPEQVSPDYPYLLITGRVLQQYNVGSMTRRTPCQALADADELVMNPLDATREGLADGDRVTIESRFGRTSVNMRTGTEMPERMVFLSFHYPETHANALTGPNADPQSHCPEYKLTAVHIAGGKTVP